jgi:CheY-like chemotaxis protein
MNAIIGFTKVVLRTELTSKQKEYLNAIKTSGDALIVLINDILDLAKVDSGKMTFEKIPFKIKSSITSMIHLFEPKIREKNLILKNIYDPLIPIVVVGDSIRLHQIIINLLSNAVKFTTHGSITIDTRLVEDTNDFVKIQFQVKDTGIGITKSKIGSIFENFQQASSSTSRVFGGTGLGLAIAKQLVESQGGKITVESEIMEGSTFTVLLNFGKSNELVETEVESLEINPTLGNVRVLLVEDIALNQLLMKTLLDDIGFEIDIAADGKIAIEKLQESRFDIVLMDLQMPEMNGFEATTYIRKVMKSTIPIIALTADVTTADASKCLEVGMDDYLAKPVDEKLLYQKIINLISSKLSVHDTIDFTEKNKPIKYTDLKSLNKRTKSNPALIKEMIMLYLEQTPPLILSMKKSYNDKNWHALHATVHKMIPSFSIMGISNDFELMAKKIQDFAKKQEQTDSVYGMVEKLEEVCLQACRELKEELNNL